jgi:ring-1,2-phenylacetyl-CoA epoxidase subunit PaaC
MVHDSALFQYLLRLGDNCLIMGQRLSEWCGHGPALEEDLALTNVALDLIGQARLWLSYAAEVEGGARDEDQLAFLRDAGDFRNVLLVEQPNGNFADTIARQFYFDTWHYFLLLDLRRSANPRVAEIAEKSVKEVAYHVRRSADWVVRLGDGTDESHGKMQAAIDQLWGYTGELFAADGVDEALHRQKVAFDPAKLRAPWLDYLAKVLDEATLTLPEQTWMQRGGREGIHSEHLGYVLAEMQFLQRAYPGARW